MLKGFLDVWCNEPIVVIGVLQTVIAMGMSFGLKLTADQVAAVMAAASAVGALVARSRVTPK